MNYLLHRIFTYAPLFFWVGFISCTGSKQLTDKEFQPSRAKADSIVRKIPDYSSELQSLKGKGRAIVSEPGNTERVTVLFSSTRNKSLVTVRNGIGIEGGQLLTDGDTLLVYNKIDKFARKIPIRGSNLNRINRLASLNILEMINYPVRTGEIEAILENKDSFKLQLSGGTEVFVDKNSHLIQQVHQPEDSRLPYSKIIYDAYGTIEGFRLPRRISIFGSEKESKIALQLTTLEINPDLGPLIINLPDDIPVYYQ